MSVFLVCLVPSGFARDFTFAWEANQNTTPPPDPTPPPDTKPPSDTTPPEFTSWPMVTEKTDDTAIIEWSTNEQSDSIIRYGLATSTWENSNSEIGSSNMTKNHRIILMNLKDSTTWDQYSETVADDTFVKKHTVILTGLREGERYYFRAGSKELTFQLGSGMAGNGIATQAAYSVSHSASETSCFISATGK